MNTLAYLVVSAIRKETPFYRCDVKITISNRTPLNSSFLTLS